MRDLTVSAVAAALASTMRPCDCGGCRNGCTNQACCSVDCVSYQSYLPWLHTSERYEPGERVQIRAGAELPEHLSMVGPHRFANRPNWRGDETTRPELLLHDDLLATIPLRPGEVVATATVGVCLPVYDRDHELSVAWEPHIAETHRGELWVWEGPGTYNDSTGRPNWKYADISECLVGQQWTPTVACETCRGAGWRTSSHDDSTAYKCGNCIDGRRQCYGVRLEQIEVTE